MLLASELAGSHPAMGSMSGSGPPGRKYPRIAGRRSHAGRPARPANQLAGRLEVQPGQERGDHRQVRKEPRDGVVGQAAGAGHDRRRVERGEPGEHRRGKGHGAAIAANGRAVTAAPVVIRPLSRWASAVAALIAVAAPTGSWLAIGSAAPGIGTGDGGGVRAANGPRGRVSRR